jgi:amino acid permease
MCDGLTGAQVIQWAVTLPVELTAASFTIQYWAPDFPVAASITIFYIAMYVATRVAPRFE